MEYGKPNKRPKIATLQPSMRGPPMPHYLGRPVAFGIHQGAPGAEQGNLHAPILARIARPGQGETKKTGAVKAPVRSLIPVL